ncbi:MAG: putative baseplate assembly protein [Ilumatobacteraceae bacterium]|nr:putative baseplate assembly protein [Ilumatobacteraceae bacterium]
MSLPVPNLDDRRFQDIVDEAKRLIPSLCPEWTNHNVSDPGVALIELFAWMSEMVIFRLNQTPDKLYTQFLNLLGVRPFPSQAATADLTFWLSAVTAQPVVVLSGTEVGTNNLDEAEVFATVADLRIEQPVLQAAFTGRGEEGLVDVLSELRFERERVRCFPSDPITPGDCFYLGFESSLAGQVLELTVTATALGVGIEPGRPPVLWEVWSGEYWIPCEVHVDTTGGINRNGVVQLMVPNAHEPLTLEGTRSWWLRLRLLQAVPGQPTYHTSPELFRLAVACRGGTVLAEHSARVTGEVVGRSNGIPGQEHRLKRAPVLPRRENELVQVITNEGATDWTEVTDFALSAADDRHVMWDDAQGSIAFGPAVRYADGSIVQHGAIPTDGALLVVREYRHGGGAAGNVGAGTITALRSTIPYIDRVENLRSARGGVDAETDDGVKTRGPMTLRTGQRAVTTGDYERLALQSTLRVARARCLRPTQSGGPVRVLVVPQVDKRPEAQTIDDYVLLEPLYRTVAAYLDERRVLGATVEVTTPYYVGVSVAALVRSAPGRPPTIVRQDVLDEVYRYLSPLTGGPDGDGWPWDVPLTTASLQAVVAEVRGVVSVDELVMFAVDLRNGQRIGESVQALRLDARSLFLGFKHRVVVK